MSLPIATLYLYSKTGEKGTRQCIGCGCDKNRLYLACFHILLPVKKCEEKEVEASIR